MDSKHNQPKLLFRIALCTYLPLVLLMLGVNFCAKQAGIPYSHLYGDPLQILHAPLYIGFFSNIGVLVMAAAASICIFSGHLLLQRHRLRDGQFLFFAGLLTGLLVLDDFFMIHDGFHDGLGWPEWPIYALYGLILIIGLWRFRSIFLETEWLLLLAVLGFFGISLWVDSMEGFVRQRSLIEDGAKLLGMVTWFVYWFRFSRSRLGFLEKKECS